MKCKMNQKCGGCLYINQSYDYSLNKKYEEMKKLYKDFNIKVHPLIRMENPYHYRNKVIVAFDKNYNYGLYEENSHKIVPVKECLLHDEQTYQVLNKIQQLVKKYRMSIYDSYKNKGFLRHVLIRRAIVTNQTLVCLVINEDIFKGSKNFCQELVKSCPHVTSIVLNINKRKTSIVLGEKEKVIYGKGFVVDELLGLTFKISSKSFYQINHDQCVKLYQKAIELLNPTSNDLLLDTYCGIGTIGMCMASKAKEVIGVELNSQAVNDAINNAKMNHLDNIRFINQDATIFMKEYASQNKKVDCVIMDPPRSGSTQEFIQVIYKLSPSRVIYISCDPSTQVRDLKEFKKCGYTFNEVYLFDLFPFTSHVETVCLMSRKEK